MMSVMEEAEKEKAEEEEELQEHEVLASQKAPERQKLWMRKKTKKRQFRKLQKTNAFCLAPRQTENPRMRRRRMKKTKWSKQKMRTRKAKRTTEMDSLLAMKLVSDNKRRQ